MPRYYTLGKIPPKRHTVFENPNGGLYQEELFGTAGFAGMSSLIYHLNPPTVVTEIKKVKKQDTEKREYKIKEHQIKGDDEASARELILLNMDK